MRVLFIGKFPPIQGGVAADAYNLVEQMLKAGFDVHVISDCLSVESEHRIFLTPDDVDTLCYRGRPWESGFTFDPVPPFGRHRKKIPRELPTESLLYGRASRACAGNRFDFVISNYLFPYGMVASRVAKDHSLRHVVLHAGSDVFDLLCDPDLWQAARSALAQAWLVLTVESAVPKFTEMGVHANRLRTDIHTLAWNGPFYSGAPRDPFRRYLASVSESRGIEEPQVLLASAEGEEQIFRVGICGKAGHSKGTSELLAALRYLAVVDPSIQCVAAWAGLTSSGLVKAIQELSGTNLSVLSPLPRWRMPQFVNFCDACLFLEHDFWLQEHTPQFPLEVLASGTHSIFSSDVAARVFPVGLPSHARVTRVRSPMTWRHIASAIVEARQEVLNRPPPAATTIYQQELPCDIQGPTLWDFLGSESAP